jgi:hypothetical protein
MTVTLKLGEVLVDAVVKKLRDGLDARCQALNASKQDDMVIVAPAETSYFTGRVRELPITPAIFVMEGPSRFREEGPHGLMTETEILVHVIESDQTGPRLARRLQRHVRAVVECLWDDEPLERLTNSAFHFRPLRTVPGPVFEPEHDDRWRAAYVVVFRAQTIEHE